MVWVGFSGRTVARHRASALFRYRDVRVERGIVGGIAINGRMELKPDRAAVQARADFFEFRAARPHPYQRKDPRRSAIDLIERAIVEPRAYSARHSGRGHRRRQAVGA